MKTFFFRLVFSATVIAGFMLGFSACEQERIIEELFIAEEGSNMTEGKDNNTLGCGAVPSKEQIDYLNKTRKKRQIFSQKRQAGATTYYIPVVNHIVRRSNGTGGLALSRLASAMQALNTTYADANIEFYELKPINYIDSDVLHGFNISEESLISKYDVPNAVNIYYCASVSTNGPVSGYTQYPPNEKRIMMAHMNVENGVTLRHEMAHYFSVFHTHGKAGCDYNGDIDELVNGSNCEDGGDQICDTPADPCLTDLVDSNCNYIGTALDANDEPYTPLTDNLMSYAMPHGTECRENFTDGQLDRIFGGFVAYHTNLVSRLTWNYSHFGGNFNVCVSRYPGYKHQFRYRRSDPDGISMESWVYRPPTTSRCFSIPANGCYYIVQVRIKNSINGAINQWDGWSDSEILKCAVPG